MIRRIENTDRCSVYEAENIYRDCNFLMVDVEKEAGVTYGVVVAVSESKDDHRNLVDLEKEQIQAGHRTLIGGEYQDSIDINDMRYEKIA